MFCPFRLQTIQMSKASPEGVGVNFVNEVYPPCYTINCPWYDLKKNKCDRVTIIKMEAKQKSEQG